MGSQTKSDQKKISVHISNEKCANSTGCRFPLEEIQNPSDFNTQIEESCGLSNNKRKVDEYWNSHWTSMANMTVSSFVIAETNHHYGLKDSPPTASLIANTSPLTEGLSQQMCSISSGTNSTITVDRTASGCTSAQESSDNGKGAHTGESLSESLINKAVLVDLINTSTDDMQWNTQIQEYMHMDSTFYECEHCNNALFWYDERSNKSYNSTEPKFKLCCNGGKFTSMGAKIDHGVTTSRGPPTFILSGENYHLMGSLIPPAGNRPKFAQLYVFDTQNEVQNRMVAIRGENNKEIHEDIVRDFKKMLDENNVLVRAFRMARESVAKDANTTIKLRLLGKREKDGRRYNLPLTNEVAALIVGDFDIYKIDRDIVVETQTEKLQRINQLNPTYLGLQYPLLYPYGEDGYKEDIPLNNRNQNAGKRRQEVSIREFFAFRIQEKLADGSPLLYSRQLFQQFLVDGYPMIESSQLSFIRLYQEKFRCEIYKRIKEAVLSGETTPSSRGKCIILPSSFTGGPRYTIQNYQDAMAICKVVGYPDLFITFTCNSKWPEVEEFIKNKELNPEDRPDIVCRAFKAKLDLLIKDIRVNKIFGRVSAVVYTIEFQKRGLPHAHILLFLHKDDKYPTAEDIDKIISAEIPDKELDPEYFEVVQKHMIHGPCGLARKDSPCMENGKCIRHFPKRFLVHTTVDDDGYLIYRRREDGRTINKLGVDLDNRFVVPHNKLLLMRYETHINVEWCNQSKLIKYLFKYVNKGHDRVTTLFYKSATESAELDEYDEVSMYYDCRYISPCEAAWRIFGFNIHYRDPLVVRLGFHLPDEQNIIFKDHENLDDVIKQASVKESMFL
ncbi:uncharacterized protein LOC107633785 [Arachis ipaensis]|uniref:uncharacterized protein LOC107633785 n=1 Tax=Arachis ipaensis TaxID=130454 RepID=UPI000A2B311E|nr:uncharacterized protein LOC107633785 [Arachis ipaensis]XP_025640836.1 uncharacterized protein LOC112735518 [Arachis hypogaea]